MNDITKIKRFIELVIDPNDEICRKEEMLGYLFTTRFADQYQDVILPKLRQIVSNLVKITYDFYSKFKRETRRKVIEVCIAELLTCDKCRNTGAVTSDFANIVGIIKDGNIREIFFVMDEFIHNCCFIMSWLLYCHDIDHLVKTYGLSEENIMLKLKYVAEIISGSKQKNFSNKTYLQNFIRTCLGTKYDNYAGKGKIYHNIYPWEVVETPSICHLWNMQERTYYSHKLLFQLEYQRNADHPKQYKPYGVEIGDTSVFDPPDICYDNKKSYRDSIKIDDVQLPPLSLRELNFLKQTNRDVEINRLANWKGGCCYYYVKNDTVTYKISLDKHKPRMTSYSGHIILDFELLSLLDPDFESWKGIYLLIIMATMIPYCHHSTHEIFSTATYWGIDYDIDENYYQNFIRLIEKYIPNELINHDNLKHLLEIAQTDVNGAFSGQ